MKKCVFLLLLALAACDYESVEDTERRRKREKWEEPCRDEATLLATTSGSPSDRTCENRLHRMRFQVVTAPSSEEGVALIVCECDRGDAGQ